MVDRGTSWWHWVLTVYSGSFVQQEFEAKFLDIEPEEIRAKLRRLGARSVHAERLIRRTVYDFPSGTLSEQGAWVRVRDEGDRITLTFKQVAGTGITDVREIELTVDNFERAGKLMEALGCRRKAYQETKRERWILDGAELTIDTWPGLRPFMEIEAADETSVDALTEKLGLDYRQAVFGSVDVVYERELGIPPDEINNRTPLLTFAHPPPVRKKTR